jgi:serine/threonine protein kinase
MLNLVLKILGLEFLHGNHILHRDLKLSNVMLKSDGHIVIVDLGLLKVFGDTLESEKERPGATKEIGEPRATSRCGTVCYMAPEVLNREEYDFKADWWSLGICVYAMLQGDVRMLMSDSVCTHKII